VQTCDKRQTLEAQARASKGGDYPSFLYFHHLEHR
jgi:hypothetical protein